MNEVTRLIRATRNSWDGIVHGVHTEAALRTETITLVVAVPVAALIADRPTTFMALVGVLLVLLAVELLNTAIEKLCDLVQPEIHPVIKIVKDLGSAAVTAAVLLSAGTWGAVIWELVRSR